MRGVLLYLSLISTGMPELRAVCRDSRSLCRTASYSWIYCRSVGVREREKGGVGGGEREGRRGRERERGGREREEGGEKEKGGSGEMEQMRWGD